ncbi:hypothetical protein [Paenibacillus marinisediminis]
MFILILSFSFIVGCSKEQEVSNSYEASGQYWKAYVSPEVQQINGMNKFIITYQYLGSLDDINKAQKIVFAQGTLLGTQVINVFDREYKEELMRDGQYSQEYEETYGVIIDDLKHKKTTEFNIEYALLRDQGMNTFEAINKDGMNIQVQWEMVNEKFEDEINIRRNQ